MIRDKVSLLSSPFRKARAQFNERITGVKDTDPRWRTCTGVTNDNMGVPLGSLYVKRFFDQFAIEKVCFPEFIVYVFNMVNYLTKMAKLVEIYLNSQERSVICF